MFVSPSKESDVLRHILIARYLRSWLCRSLAAIADLSVGFVDYVMFAYNGHAHRRRKKDVVYTENDLPGEAAIRCLMFLSYTVVFLALQKWGRVSDANLKVWGKDFKGIYMKQLLSRPTRSLSLSKV